ncbi:MAG: lysophospholipid acyltransferase family protein [bacterium]
METPGWLYKITWPWTHYLVTNLTVTVGYIFFHLFNRTRVIGRKHVPQQANTLLVSNHQSMIDSFLIGLCCFYPRSLIRPSLIPWSPAAAENFYRTPFLSWLADNWKCIPVKKGRKDLSALRKMADAIKKSPMILFPEGTRSRDGSIGSSRPGVGMLILESRPTVVPVYIEGMNRILPIGSVFPRFFKKIYVVYGKPLDFSEFYGWEKTKARAEAITERVMQAIRALHDQLHGLNDI